VGAPAISCRGRLIHAGLGKIAIDTDGGDEDEPITAPQQGVREPFGLFGAIAAGVDDQIPVPPLAPQGAGPRLCPREAGSAPPVRVLAVAAIEQRHLVPQSRASVVRWRPRKPVPPIINNFIPVSPLWRPLLAAPPRAAETAMAWHGEHTSQARPDAARHIVMVRAADSSPLPRLRPPHPTQVGTRTCPWHRVWDRDHRGRVWYSPCVFGVPVCYIARVFSQDPP
jgi:hypothetical protein